LPPTPHLSFEHSTRRTTAQHGVFLQTSPLSSVEPGSLRCKQTSVWGGGVLVASTARSQTPLSSEPAAQISWERRRLCRAWHAGLRRLSRSAERSRTTRHARCAPARHATATVARVTPCDSVARGYTDTNTDMYVYIWTPGRVVRVADRWAERHENEAGDAKVQAGRRDTVAPMPAAAARGRGRGRGARGRHSRGPGQAVAFRSLMPIPPLPTVSSSDNAATSTSATAPG
jgi:hypothetical protein